MTDNPYQYGYTASTGLPQLCCTHCGALVDWRYWQRHRELGCAGAGARPRPDGAPVHMPGERRK